MQRNFLSYLHLLFYCITKGLVDLAKPVIHLPADPIDIKEDEVKIWMIGHASVLINFYGVTILTDPVFAYWLPFPRRILAPGYSAQELPYIDYTIISHGHYDHLNLKSLKQLSRKTNTVILPKNYLHLVERMGFGRKIGMDWNERKEFTDLEISCFRPVHIGGRLPWERKDRGYNGYMIKRNNKNILFAGDSGYGNVFSEIGNTHKVDVAILGIGAYKPYAFLRHWHMSPEDALEAFCDLRADHLIPMHWGNFRLGLEGMDEPAEALAKAAQGKTVEDKIHILQNGQSFTLDYGGT